MWRNPFAAVLAAVKSLLPKRTPARRTVSLAMPSEAKEATPSRPRAHSKHGKTSLVWRQKNHRRRRALLAMRWSAVMAQVSHPLVNARLRWRNAHQGRPMPSNRVVRKAVAR